MTRLVEPPGASAPPEAPGPRGAAGPPGGSGDRGCSGLTGAEVAERVAAGLVNRSSVRTSRTLGQIVRANVLTRFNALLGALLAVVLVVGPPQDALFGLVIVANSAVGIVQELRAKRTLDRLSVLTAPTATVLRDGRRVEVPAAEVVRDDAVVLGRGDQVVVDGPVLVADGLEVDESLLTGEAEPVVRVVGDPLLSGSFVVAGTGLLRAERIGDAAYAVSLAAQAQRFALVHSELRAALDRLLRGIGWVLLPTAVLLVVTQLRAEGVPVAEAVRASVAGVVGMVPEGLVLLTSVAFAVGVVRLGRRRVLVQELPAIEGLARVDVVGIDKTGPLTEGAVEVEEVLALGPCAEDLRLVLAALAAADDDPGPAVRAIAAAGLPAGPSPGAPRSRADTAPADAPPRGQVLPGPPGAWRVADRVPFSSARRWSAVTFARHGSWVLGAPEVLLDPSDTAHGPALEAAAARAAAGRRVLLLAAAPSVVLSQGGAPSEDAAPSGGGAPSDAGAVGPPGPLVPAGLVVLVERLRPDARDTVRYLGTQGVRLDVLSGDSPRTVGAVAAAVGVPGADRPVDAGALPADDALPTDARRLDEALTTATVFGRVTPQQKRAMVRTLRRRGHVVAMTGDGVNDVLALKEADIGVAMGSGAPAARAVAQLVLLDSRFDVLPDVVAEGRRILADIERVAHLFLTKTVYVAVLAVAVGVAGLPFPFYPRHLTVISTLTIGVPAFFLALAPDARRARPGLLRRVLRFAVPAGVVAAAATFTSSALMTGPVGLDVPAARTAATVTLFGVGTTVLVLLARPWTWGRAALVVVLVGAFAVLHVVPAARAFFALTLLPAEAWAVTGAVVGVAAALLVPVWWVSGGADRPDSTSLPDRDAGPRAGGRAKGAAGAGHAR
jgi:cation-transporting ATPase E